MSAIAHWLEQEGISTVVIGLVRLHLEKMTPPRALWVPFELGRPVGPPGNPGFQRQVLEQALGMVETAESTTIQDFEKDDPRAAAGPEWSAPDLEDQSSIVNECAALKPAYQRQCVDKSRTSVGVAKIPVTDLATLVDEVYVQNSFKSLRDDISERLMFRLALDDLKAYYIEAALADHNAPSSRQLHDWLWQETLLGRRMRELRHRFKDSSDVKMADLGTKFIVPHAWRDSVDLSAG